ncbi:hypothetical protein LP417_35585 (plasmid) [Polaromonas sp. P1-6]|nr:hypothetical protein LP417_35585 [Polaromonas sp. P1-6]
MTHPFFALTLAFLSAFSGQAHAEDEQVVADLDASFATPREARTAHRANGRFEAPSSGVFLRQDGTCIQRIVHDHGYTYVTIDAKGTLSPMKNDIVEDVAVACPN